MADKGEPEAREQVRDESEGEDCDRCGETFDRDDLVPGEDGGVYCEACFEETDGGREP